MAEQLALEQRLAESAAQLTATNGPAARLDAWCTARAATSLPVPLSPANSTVAWVGATLRIASTTAAIVGSPQVNVAGASSSRARSRAATSCRRSSARATTSRSSAGLPSGFCR